MVCSGASCRATLEHASFFRCSLVVLSGAKVTLNDVTFRQIVLERTAKDLFQHLSAAGRWGLGMLVHGTSSKIVVNSGYAISVTGAQVLAVQAGCHATARQLDIVGSGTDGTPAIGVEGEGSMLELEMCTVVTTDFDDVVIHDEHVVSRIFHYSVCVGNRAQDMLEDCRFEGCGVGLGVAEEYIVHATGRPKRKSTKTNYAEEKSDEFDGEG